MKSKKRKAALPPSEGPVERLSSRQLAGLRKDHLIHVVSIYLKDNCLTYNWGSRALGFCRARDLPRLYGHVDELSTAVYDSATEHFFANQLAALVLKYPLHAKDFGLPKSALATAYDKFLDGEAQCRRTNRRFRAVMAGRRTSFRAKLEKMRAFVHRVLGEKPRDGYLENSVFGPGSNIGVTGDSTSYVRKFFAQDWSVTPTAIPYVRAAIRGNYHLVEGLCQKHRSVACYDMQHVNSQMEGKWITVSFNKLSFVLKTAKTLRCIAVEPLGNNFVQSAVGVEICRLLLPYGIDLSDQSRNARMARIGSISGRFCTMDLTNASGTNALLAAKFFVPDTWFRVFEDLRSPSYFDPATKSLVRYNVISSMGNGFTFPLETLIFLSACVASGVRLKDLSVYGDDIVVPSEKFHEIKELLAFTGYTVNKAKSFYDGPFRESCGSDWYDGQDVRPVYLDHFLDSVSDRMVFHNATLVSERVKSAFVGVREYLRSLSSPEEILMRPEEGNRQPRPERTLERWEVYNLNGAFSVPQDVFMSCRSAKWDKAQHRWTWLENIYKPKSDKIAETYPYAQYISFLRGSLGGAIHLRHQTSQCLVRK